MRASTLVMRTAEGLVRRTSRIGLAVVAPLNTYLAVLTIAAWRSTRASPPPASPRAPRRRFAVLVPAHNEELLLGDTLHSLCAVDYPPEMVSVHVVADHCDDGTSDVARVHGVQVHDHVDPEPRGKGPALQWLFERLRAHGEPMDTVVIVDADSVVNPRFLRALDERLDDEAGAVQALYAVRGPLHSSSQQLRAAALALRHHVRPLGRTALGASCGLFGNGMAFDVPLLERHRWSEHLTEDLELQVQLVLDGVTVAFEPNAVVWAEMPGDRGQARSQNERWERGRLQLARRYVPRLLAAATRRRHDRRPLVDTTFDVLVPPLSVLVAASSATMCTASLAAAMRRSPSDRRVLWLAGGATAALVFHVVGGLRIAQTPSSTYRSLLRAPQLVAWKTWLWLRVALGSTDVRWVRTARNEEAVSHRPASTVQVR